MKAVQSYIDSELLHGMVVAMVTGGAAPPEAVLAQLVVTAALTLVTESHKGFPITSLTLHRMKHWNAQQKNGLFSKAQYSDFKGKLYFYLVKFLSSVMKLENIIH